MKRTKIKVVANNNIVINNDEPAIIEPVINKTTTSENNIDNSYIFNVDTIEKFITQSSLCVHKIDKQTIDITKKQLATINDNLSLKVRYLVDQSVGLLELIKKIEKRENELKKDDKHNQFANISQLSTVLTNYDQVSILKRIQSDSDDYGKIYLQNYVPNIDAKKKTLLGTINILGQFNVKKQERESYQVKVFKNDPKGSFWCSCADHKFNSSKKNIVCKHISFIVCKVIRVLQLYYWDGDSKTLSDEHLQLLLNKFSDNSEFWKNKQLVRNIKEVTLNTFKTFTKVIDDVCTFCYDQMSDVDQPNALCCPTCSHCFHQECMDIWLESYSKCSYCSSEFWKHYNQVKNGESINISNAL
jgi:hypothetical protein